MVKVCTHLLRALYVRDSRLQFCSGWQWPVSGAVPEGAAAVAIVAGTHVRPNPRQLRRPPNLTAAMALSHGKFLLYKKKDDLRGSEFKTFEYLLPDRFPMKQLSK